MPPLTVDGKKSVSCHRCLEKHPVFILLIGHPPEVRVRLLTKPVEGASHIQLLTGLHVEQGQVHRAPSAVAGSACDVTLGEQLGFLELRIKEGLHALIQVIDPPQEKAFDCPDRAVTVKYLQAVA